MDASAREASEPWPFVVIGAGAAGLLAALFAARGGVRTLLVESHTKPGAKIRVSGGGRCNVLPSALELADFHTEGSRNAMRNLLFSWPLEEVREFFERDLGVPLKVEETGKVFPVSDDPSEITNALLAACERAGVKLVTDTFVTDFSPSGSGWTIACKGPDGTDAIHADALIVATGCAGAGPEGRAGLRPER